MAVWFFWITLGEQLLPAMINRVLPAAGPVLGMLPFASSQQLLPFWKFDAATYERMANQAAAAGESAPELPNVALWLGLNAGWALLFLTVTYLVFRRRDL